MSEAHRDYFNRLAPEWNEKMPEDPTLRNYLVRFGIKSGDRVLDIGAGTGRMTRYLIDMVGPDGRVITEDIAEDMLTEGMGLLPFHRNWLCDTVSSLAIRAEVFDKVVCFSAFPHFTDPLAALREMRRVLCKNGQLLILHVSSSTELNAFHAELDGIVSSDRLPSIDEMRLLLHQAGFETVRTEESDGLYWAEAVKPSS